VTDTIRCFYDALNRQEASRAAWIAGDLHGLVMRVAINEMDLELQGVTARHLDPDENRDRGYLTRLGAARVIKLALDAHPNFLAPTWTIPRSPELSGPVLGLISDLGKIDHGRRLAQIISAWAGRIEMESSDRYRVILPAQLIDQESAERELDEYYAEQGRRTFEEGWQTEIDAAIGDDVKRLLTDLVFPFRDQFIGYESDPKLDVYFFGRGYNEIQLAKGYDTFHFATRFGGMTFQHYKLAAAFILQAAFRHRAFVLALLKKSPGIRVEDILTVSAETAGFMESMRDFINHWGALSPGHEPVDDQGVRTLFDVLSVSRRNRELLDRPGAPIAPLVQCSDDHVVKILSGANQNILLFLLNSLQHRFPQDYDRAQRDREGVMQRSIARVMRTALPNLNFRGNVTLRLGRKMLTDIDLVAIEPSTGRIILFQLKHQDHYGADVATMLSRTNRLNQQVAGWLSKVREWLHAVSLSEVRATLRLPASVPDPQISLIVVTRHFAHTLRDVAIAEDATFANWTQLVTAADKMAEFGEASLEIFIETLRALSQPEEQRYHPPEPSREWRVGDLIFTIEQAAS
jgi:hypothetical protein